jgi:type I restriction enzyme S subunit
MKATYSAYKQTPIKWLPEIPEHWNLIGFNILFKDNNEKNRGLIENKVLSLSYGNIIEKQKDENYGLIPESFETYQIVNPGYIILRLTDLQNDKRSLRVGYSNYRGIITSAYTGLVGDKVDSKYYYYFLHTLDIKKFFYSLGGGVRQSSDYNELRKLKFPFPPLPEQSSIVQFLDKKTELINTFIAKKQRLIDLLKEQKQVVIKNLLVSNDYKTGLSKLMKLKYVARICNGAEQKAVQDDLGEYPIYGSGGIFGKANKYIYNKPSVLLGRKGTVDKPIFVSIPFWVVDTAFYTKISSKVKPEYFFYACCFIDFKPFIYGSAIPSMSQTTLNNLKISVPPIDEQDKIVHSIKIETKKIDIAINRIEKEIEIIKEYKQSLIAEAVTGKIKVTNSNKNHSEPNLEMVEKNSKP